jgi:hypothetical protein
MSNLSKTIHHLISRRGRIFKCYIGTETIQTQFGVIKMMQNHWKLPDIKTAYIAYSNYIVTGDPQL